jgi:hypothetical protein
MGRVQYQDLGRPQPSATWDDIAKEESRKYRRTVSLQAPVCIPCGRRERPRGGANPRTSPCIVVASLLPARRRAHT